MGSLSSIFFFCFSYSASSFLNAQFRDIARIMASASLNQRDEFYASIRTYASALTVAAQATNQSWPTVNLPYFEAYGGRFRQVSHADFSSLLVVVPHEERTAYEAHMEAVHQTIMQESHLIKYGHVENLAPTDKDYEPTISVATEDGFAPEVEKEVYFPVYMNSPPLSTYRGINWNAASSSVYAGVLNLVVKNKNETFASAVQVEASNDNPPPFDGTHDRPQVRLFHPVLERVDDTDSKVVGVLVLAASLDFFTSGLLPDDVQGIMVVIRNNCRQNFTYVWDGAQATYLGAQDLHEEEFKQFEVQANLTTHPSDRRVLEECAYTQVSVRWEPLLMLCVCYCSCFAFPVLRTTEYLPNSAIPRRL